MKIKYIKENFFDDDPNIDNISPEEIIKQDHIDILFSKIIPDEIIESLKKLHDTVRWWQPDGFKLTIPVPHAIGNRLHRYPENTTPIEVLRLSTSPVMFKQAHHKIEVKCLYNDNTNEVNVILNWIRPEGYEISHNGGTDFISVYRSNPDGSNYRTRNFKSTAKYLKLAYSRLINIFELNKIPFSKITLSVSINGVNIFNFSKLDDYYDYIKLATSFSMKDFTDFEKRMQDPRFGVLMRYLITMFPDKTYDPPINHVDDFLYVLPISI